MDTHGHLALVPPLDDDTALLSNLEITPEMAHWITDLVQQLNCRNGRVTLEWRDYHYVTAEPGQVVKVPAHLKPNFARKQDKQRIYGPNNLYKYTNF